MSRVAGVRIQDQGPTSSEPWYSKAWREVFRVDNAALP